MTPQEYVEENWETFNQGGGNSVEDMARLIAAWDSAELRHQSQELQRAREEGNRLVAAVEQMLSEDDRHRIGEPPWKWMDHACPECPGVTMKTTFRCPRHFARAVLASLAALTQPAPEKP